MRTHMIGFANATKDSHNPEQLLCWAQHQCYIALANALNGAYSLGLGACPMTAFNPPEFSRMLKLPASSGPHRARGAWVSSRRAWAQEALSALRHAYLSVGSVGDRGGGRSARRPGRLPEPMLDWFTV